MPVPSACLPSLVTQRKSQGWPVLGHSTSRGYISKECGTVLGKGLTSKESLKQHTEIRSVKTQGQAAR